MEDNMENRTLFANTMYGIAEDFGGTLSDNNLAVRFRALQEYSIDQITRAGTWLLKHREKTFPAVPTTKEFIGVIEGWKKPQVSAKSRAEVQADMVLIKLKHHGRAGKADFCDSITQHLMTTRWPYRVWACNVKEDELKWFRKEFIEAYQAYAETEKAEQLVLDVPGNNVVAIGNLKKLAAQTAKTMEA